MSRTHNKVIAAAAKAELGPLGFKRMGQSRLWLKDHGFWLNLVAFTPSRWSVTVDLDNAAHWIWAGTGFMSLNYIMERTARTEFENEEQFSTAVGEIARTAAVRATEIEHKFTNFSAIAAHVVRRAEEQEELRSSWFGYYAGVASGITNDLDGAKRFLRGVTDDRVVPRAERFFAAVDSAIKFKATVNQIVAQQRTDLKLPPLEADAF